MVSRPLLALVLCAGVPALAQPSTQLSELKRARDAARDAHLDSIVRIRLLSQHRRRTDVELGELTQQVRALQAEDPGVLRDRLLRTTRHEQNQVSRRLATLKLRIKAEEDTRRVRRLKLVRASWSWVSRLLETADRAWRTGRHKQAKEHTDAALEELKRLEDLEALEDTPSEDYLPQPIDPSVTLEELAELRELYEAWAEAFAEQARDLEPVEKKLQSRVKHLDRLVQYRYAIPTLGERLKRAQHDLERVTRLRQNAEVRAARYRKEILAIDAAKAKRALEPSREHDDGE